MRALTSLLSRTHEVAVLLADTVRALPRLPHHGDRVLREIVAIGTRSTVFILATAAFMGVITMFQVASQALKLIPDLSLSGAGFIRISTAEMTPLMVGLMMAARVGSAIASEMASMVVTEQMDALRLANTDPVEFLVAPKLVASLIAVPILGLMALAASILAGMLVGWQVFDVHPLTFLNFRYTYEHHGVFFLLKLTSFGLLLPVVASIEGMVAGRRGAFSVGRAATRGVITSSFFIILADLALSLVEHTFWG